MISKKEGQKKKGIALFEIMLMVMTTLAVAFVMQQSFGIVSARGSIVPSDDGKSWVVRQDGKDYAIFNEYTDAQEAVDRLNGLSGAGVSSGKTALETAPVKPAVTGVPTGVAGVSVIQKAGTTGWTATSTNGATINIEPNTVLAGETFLSDGSYKSITAVADGQGKYDIWADKGVFSEGTHLGTMSKEEADGLQKTLSGQAGITQLGKPLGGMDLMKSLGEGVAFAVGAFTLVQLLSGAFGATESMRMALSASAAMGVMAWKATAALTQGRTGTFWQGGGAMLVGVAAAIITFVLLYEDEKKELVSFSCEPFQPPLGGKQCEECNKYSFKPCTEYRCKSLGQACELLNAGTKDEACAWVNKYDTTSPIISTWKKPLYPNNLTYNPDTTRPSGLGSKIIKTGGTTTCLDAFTPLSFGVTTNEPSQCRIDYLHTNSYSNMTYMFGESNLFLYNHSQSMRLPAPESSTNLTGSPAFKNDGSYTLYVRCIDANGNENVDEYTFKFCVDKSPDTTPPVIETTSIISGSPVQFNISAVPIQVYTNEPATCKWSRTSKDYGDMENNMSCSGNLVKINSDLVYPCSGTLTGVKDKEMNAFYFRCKDNPQKADKDRNVMTQSYQLILRGSQSLNILNAGPNGTVYGSTDVAIVNLSVETDDGSDEGKAWCYYSDTGNSGDYIMMYETNNTVRHVQQLDLASGTYTYYFKCIDNGGNSAEDSTTFTVFVDKSMPLVTRVYKDTPDALKIVTDEDAECAYSFNSCNFNFDEGTKMIYNPVDVKNVHLAQWKDNAIYYVKCRDAYGNEPSPNQCNIIANAAKLSATS